MDNEQEGITKTFDICSAKSIKDFVLASKPLLECSGFFGDDMKEFTGTDYKIFDHPKPYLHAL